MTTVNIQDNPVVAIQGAKDSDATIITSEEMDGDSLVMYEVEKISTGEVLTFDNLFNSKRGGNLVSVNKTELRIILEFRTKYRARAKTQFGAWSAWVNFTTRNKRYQSPHAITQLTDDSDASAQTQGTKVNPTGGVIAQGGNRTIVVTNNAKAVETEDTVVAYNQPRTWGTTTVVNSDTVFNDGQLQEGIDRSFGNRDVPVLFTDEGATVINVPIGQNSRIRYTNRGATIDNR